MGSCNGMASWNELEVWPEKGKKWVILVLSGGRQGGNGVALGGLVAARRRLPPDLYGNLNRIRQVANCTVAE